jgi:ATP-dependent DNA helicase RecG
MASEIEAMSEHEQSLRSAMQPVYPSTETLTNRGFQTVINKLMQQLFKAQTLFTETLPDYLMQELQLISKKLLYSTFIFQKCRSFSKNSIKV